MHDLDRTQQRNDFVLQLTATLLDLAENEKFQGDATGENMSLKESKKALSHKNIAVASSGALGAVASGYAGIEESTWLMSRSWSPIARRCR